MQSQNQTAMIVLRAPTLLRSLLQVAKSLEPQQQPKTSHTEHSHLFSCSQLHVKNQATRFFSHCLFEFCVITVGTAVHQGDSFRKGKLRHRSAWGKEGNGIFFNNCPRFQCFLHSLISITGSCATAVSRLFPCLHAGFIYPLSALTDDGFSFVLASLLYFAKIP